MQVAILRTYTIFWGDIFGEKRHAMWNAFLTLFGLLQAKRFTKTEIVAYSPLSKKQQSASIGI